MATPEPDTIEISPLDQPPLDRPALDRPAWDSRGDRAGVRHWSVNDPIVRDPMVRDPMVRDPITQIEAEIERLSTDDYREWLSSALSDRVRRLGRARERLEAEYLRCLAEWDHQGAWGIDGSLSPTAWLAFNTPVKRRDALRQVRTANVVHRYSDTAGALSDGMVSASQVEILSRATTQGRDALFQQHEAVLLDAASRLDEDEFESVIKQWGNMADDKLGRASSRHIHENRYLHLHATFAGAVVVDGRLDPIAGAQLQAALERRVTPDPKDDPAPRSAAQLRADALIELVEDAEAVTDTTSRSKTRAHMNVVVDLPSLLGEPWSPVSVSELPGIGPIARNTVEELLCSSHLTRVITNGPSQILDVGRTARFISEPQRAGLVVRDRHCVFPSCRRDHRWCDAHHLTPFEESKKTDLHDLILLCRRDHTRVHRGGWSISRDPLTGRITALSPDGRQFTRTPERSPP